MLPNITRRNSGQMLAGKRGMPQQNICIIDELATHKRIREIIGQRSAHRQDE